METARLARNPHDRWIGGVCGGIARWLGWNSDMVRIVFVLASILSAAFPGTHRLHHPLDRDAAGGLGR